MKKKTLIIALFVLIGAAIYPFESTVVPEWTLEVRDVNDTLCPNMKVTESWDHYSLFIDGGGNTEDRFTDQNGLVIFPERTVRAVGIRRVVVPVIAHVLLIAHGSVGANGAVWASGLKDVAWLSYKPGKPLPFKMRVEECIPRKDLE